MQVKTIIDGHILSSGRRVMNVNYFTKQRLWSKWYKQTDGTDVFTLLKTFAHSKLEVLVPYCVDDFSGNICAKYQRNSLSMKSSEFLNDDILEKTSRLDKIDFDRNIYNGNFI